MALLRAGYLERVTAVLWDVSKAALWVVPLVVLMAVQRVDWWDADSVVPWAELMELLMAVLSDY
jgi:hypothetical protein